MNVVWTAKLKYLTVAFVEGRTRSFPLARAFCMVPSACFACVSYIYTKLVFFF